MSGFVQLSGQAIVAGNVSAKHGAQAGPTSESRPCRGSPPRLARRSGGRSLRRRSMQVPRGEGQQRRRGKLVEQGPGRIVPAPHGAAGRYPVMHVVDRASRERRDRPHGARIRFCRAPARQAATHLKHPTQSSPLRSAACLCHSTDTFPITCFGQAATHDQQAWHLRESNSTKRVPGRRRLGKSGATDPH